MLGLKVQDNADFGAQIIRKVREHETLSRVELARLLGVAASTIGRHVDALVATGYFIETVEPTKEAGRPPTRLRPNPARGCFLGVDFHAGHLFATAVDFAQRPLVRLDRPILGARGVERTLEEISGAFRELAEAAQMPVLAAGLAVPGRVDTKRGIALHYAHIPGFLDVPLAAKMREVTGVDVFLENNIRTMALAERWFGEGRGCLDLICLGVRIGVSAGVIREGRLATGHSETGGEIRGWNCPVFNALENQWVWLPSATIEKHASVPAAVARYVELSDRPEGQDEFINAAKAGDRHAWTALREVAAIHGWAISQMVQLVDPEMVVLAGPLTAIGDPYVNTVRNVALQFESTYHPTVPIMVSELGDHAGAIGAAALALERWRPADVG